MHVVSLKNRQISLFGVPPPIGGVAQSSSRRQWRKLREAIRVSQTNAPVSG